MVYYCQRKFKKKYIGLLLQFFVIVAMCMCTIYLFTSTLTASFYTSSSRNNIFGILFLTGNLLCDSGHTKKPSTKRTSSKQ
jgi:hypothetical protein